MPRATDYTIGLGSSTPGVLSAPNREVHMTATARRLRSSLMICAGAAFFLNSCATKSQTGAVVGAAGGAVVGGVIGHEVGSTAAGAIIGAAAGGIVGGIIGAQMDKQAKELKQNIPGAT